jgi:hypothetical protein
MKLQENVKMKKGIIACIPWLNNNTAQALYPNIYLPQKVYNDLKKSKSDPKYIAVLVHEQKHLERQKEMGPFRWGMKYSFYSKFRFNEEIIATRAQMVVLKKFKRDFDIEDRAKDLSGWLYFWSVSYETAKRELEKEWGEI